MTPRESLEWWADEYRPIIPRTWGEWIESIIGLGLALVGTFSQGHVT